MFNIENYWKKQKNKTERKIWIFSFFSIRAMGFLKTVFIHFNPAFIH